MSQQGNEECGWVTVSCRRKNRKRNWKKKTKIN